MALIALVLRDSAAAAAARRRLGNGFDLIGFVLVATFLGALEIMLDRGLEDDWFGSTFIVKAAAVCVIAFVVMIPWELSAPRSGDRCADAGHAPVRRLLPGDAGHRRHPSRDHASSCRSWCSRFGYTATWAGLVLSPGGLVTMAMMFVIGRLSGQGAAQISDRRRGGSSPSPCTI